MGAVAKDFSPPQSQQVDCPRGRFPSTTEDVSPMATHGQGTLVNLIRSSRPSITQHNGDHIFISHKRGRDSINDEEIAKKGSKECDEMRHKYRSLEERRLENILHGSPIRSQRLIGHSNLRYQWGKLQNLPFLDVKPNKNARKVLENQRRVNKNEKTYVSSIDVFFKNTKRELIGFQSKILRTNQQPNPKLYLHRSPFRFFSPTRPFERVRRCRKLYISA